MIQNRSSLLYQREKEPVEKKPPRAHTLGPNGVEPGKISAACRRRCNAVLNPNRAQVVCAGNVECWMMSCDCHCHKLGGVR
jgi:hypothetical protein